MAFDGVRGMLSRRNFFKLSAGTAGAAAVAASATALGPIETMASFNNIGSLIFLNQGGSTGVFVSFNGNPGSQFITADIKTPNQGAFCRAENQAKKLDNNNNATYIANIFNDGPGSVFFNLQGGGLS